MITDSDDADPGRSSWYGSPVLQAVFRRPGLCGERAGFFFDGLAAVRIDGKWGYVDGAAPVGRGEQTRIAR